MTTTTRKTMIIMMWNAQINEHEAVFITHGRHRSLSGTPRSSITILNRCSHNVQYKYNQRKITSGRKEH